MAIQAEIAKKIQECLKEFGFNAETKVTEHDGIVHAFKDVEGNCVRVVTHVSDQVVKTDDANFVSPEVTKMHRLNMAIRPTLTAQTATSAVIENIDKSPCN